MQRDFDIAEQLPHIAFTPHMKAPAAQRPRVTDPVQKAKRIYDFCVTPECALPLQPMYFVHENITDTAPAAAGAIAA